MMQFTRKIWSVLKHRNFTKLWAAQVCAKLSENFLTFVLVILLFQTTQSTFLVSLLVTLVSIPPIMFSAMAGVVADSWGRKNIMLATNALRFCLVVTLIVGWEHATFLIGVAFVLSILAQFFSPAEVASIPSLVPKEQLFAANTFYQMTTYASFLVGYSLAGPSLLHFGTVPTLMFSLLLYAAAAVFVLLLPSLDEHLKQLPEIEQAIVSSYRRFWKRLTDGVHFLRQHPVVLFLITQVGTVFAIERSFISLAPSFSEQFLHFNVEELSLFLILPTGIGAFVGALAANVAKRRFRKDHLITFGLLLDGITLLSIAFLANVIRAGVSAGLTTLETVELYVVPLAFISGFADPFVLVSAQTAIHERVPNKDRGRVFGALFTIINTMAIIPVLLIGTLVSGGVSIPLIVLGLGIAIVVASVFGIRFYRRYPLQTRPVEETITKPELGQLL